MLGRPDYVDGDTVFAIASNSKAFTAAALALLVDDGKVAWDAPVTRYIPDFAMSDPRVTALMTVRDLLIHSSGLPLGAGDLMWFPGRTRHSVADIVHGLRYLSLATGFRTRYAYDNVLYVVAGEVIARVSGMSWQDFIASRLLVPVGMASSVPSRALLRTGNVAGRHARRGPPVTGMGPMREVTADDDGKTDAAGGINASITDAARWLSVQLAGGKLPAGSRLWSEAQAREMWTPQTLIADDLPRSDTPARVTLSSYALGWFVQDYRGRRLIYHDGGDIGQITSHAILPYQGVGLAIYSNAEGGRSTGLRNAILDRLIDAPAFNWLGYETAALAKRQASLRQEGAASPIARPSGSPSLPLDAYVGRYRDPWYGDIVVARTTAGLSIDFVPTPTFRSVLEPWGVDAFRTRFALDVGEDAVVTFGITGTAITTVAMRALSPLADFSNDYQDLRFVPAS